MRLLRKILRDSIPELADALERSWTIALDEWLAAIGPQKDSFNAYPHLRNHEKHLERIWSAHEKHHGPSTGSLLSPIEIYVMLSSTLFHDIGRTRTSNDHGETSQVIIKKHRAALGIPSDALAEVIARISRFHDLPPGKMPLELSKLSTTSIDPYGEIRQSTIAALLTLIDYMDGTVTRVTPSYIRDSDEVGPVGAFRRVIRNVEIDFEGQMVKVVLGDFFDESPSKTEDALLKTEDTHPQWQLTTDFKRYSTKELVAWDAVPKSKKESENRRHPKLLATLNGRRVAVVPAKKQSASDPLAQELLEGLDPEIGKDIFRHVFDGRAILPHEVLVARQYVRCNPPEVEVGPVKEHVTDVSRERIEGLVGPSCLEDWLSATKDLWRPTKKKPWAVRRLYRSAHVSKVIGKEMQDRGKTMAKAACDPAPLPKELLLAVVLGNCRENAEVLRKIRQTLWAAGVPVRAWLVEWKEHLFNELGQETLEPILNTDDLERTVDAMVGLATRSIRSTGIRYDTLAAETREIDVRKTRRAVQRIGVVWRDKQSGTSGQNAAGPVVLVGQNEWRLLSGGAERGAWRHRAGDLKADLGRLSDPDVGERK